MKLLIAVFLSFALVACATGATPKTPEQMVYQLKNDYNAALAIAVAYKNLPKCELPGAPLVCSKASVVVQLQSADNVAYPAIQAAENTVRTPGAGANAQTAIIAANQALAALTSITAMLATK